MPVFTYKCNDCGKVFDDLLFAGETDDVVSCAGCGGKNVSRQMATFACGSGDGAGGGASCSSGGGFS